VDEPERPKYAPYEGKGSSIIWALTTFLYGIEEPDTRTALMNLELAIMQGQESAKKVVRELEVDFDENGGIVTPAIRRMRTRNNSVSSTLPMPVAPVSVINSNQEPVVARRGHHGGKDFASRRNGGFRESRSCSPAPQLVI
jgi:hypothetical protein